MTSGELSAEKTTVFVLIAFLYIVVFNRTYLLATERP